MAGRLFAPLLSATALAGLTSLVAWWIAGWLGFAYLLIVATISVGGLPLGWRLFGRTHAAGWLSGLLFGYAIAAFGWWTANHVLGSGATGWLTLCAAAASASWLAWRRLHDRAPLVPLHEWTSRHTSALLLTLVLVPAIVGRPFANIGAVDAEGAHRYRAYFTADFVWHMAVVEELAKPTPLPVNPYLAPERLHYYWTYFLVPAGMLALVSGLSAANAVAVNALACGLLFVGMLYLTALVAAPRRPWLAAAAVTLVFLCGSVEGLAALSFVWLNGLPVELLRDVNVDALAAWAFKGLRIDNLPRALLYTSQHATAFSFGATAVLAVAGGAALGRTAVLLTGSALAVSFAMNPFVGAVCGFVYALCVLAHTRPWRAAALLRHALALVPLAVAAAWCVGNEITRGSGGNLVIGWWGPATEAPVRTLLLSIFPAAGLPLAGWIFARGGRAPMFAVAGVLVSLTLMFSVSLRVDPHWVGFRTGHLLFGFLPALVVWSLLRLVESGRRRVAIAAAAVALATGLPTTIVDGYNAQDVDNLREGPGFRWTLALSSSQWEALEWIRRATPAEAIVQAEPISRGREAWSLIPSFAGRRMAAGLPISLLHEPRYDEASRTVQIMFEEEDADDAHRLAGELGIGYLYVDAADRARYPATRKFDTRKDLFEVAFRNSEVTIYRLR